MLSFYYIRNESATPPDIEVFNISFLLPYIKLYYKVRDIPRRVKIIALHEKPYVLFPNVLKRWSFQKNCTGKWFFLYHQERWYFFFRKTWSPSLDRNWKIIFLEKTHGNMNFFLKCSEKVVFPEKSYWNMTFLERLSGKTGFFYPKIYFFSARKMKDDLFLINIIYRQKVLAVT